MDQVVFISCSSFVFITIFLSFVIFNQKYVLVFILTNAQNQSIILVFMHSSIKRRKMFMCVFVIRWYFPATWKPPNSFKERRVLCGYHSAFSWLSGNWVGHLMSAGAVFFSICNSSRSRIIKATLRVCLQR